MGRPPEPKNYLRRERLIQLLEHEGITYYEMWKSINARFHDANPSRSDKDVISHTTLGRLVKDGDGFKNLTEEVAKLIIEYYPQYRIQWLLGYDDYMTDAELMAFVLAGAESAKSGSEIPALGGTALDASMYLMSQLSGFKLSLWRNRLDDARDVEQAVNEIKRGCIVSRDGKSAEIDIDKWSEIANEVCDFIEFKLQREIDRANPARKGEHQ